MLAGPPPTNKRRLAAMHGLPCIKAHAGNLQPHMRTRILHPNIVASPGTLPHDVTREGSTPWGQLARAAVGPCCRSWCLVIHPPAAVGQVCDLLQ